ncbi:MAG: HD domain-containing phosphohydrolase [Nevskia sp.]|nr:HD domain-containing phosphohydrolase [Nevskia sp.]
MLKKLALGEHIRVNQPLAWDVLTDRGTLLLRKGFVPTNPWQVEALIKRGAYVDEEAFNRHSSTSPAEPEPVAATLFEQWDDISFRLNGLLRRHQTEPQFVDKLTQLSTGIMSLVDQGQDVALFVMLRLDTSNNYPVAHALQVAVLCDVYGRFMNWDPADRLALVNAALTMNITILDLQLILLRQLEPLSLEQREAIRNHPTAARERLEALGVIDPVWLNLVAQHHETSDGRGYPLGLQAVAPAAEVLNVTDRYLAMTSWRYDREPKLANAAARELYVVTAGSTQEAVARLIKAFGLYPPGTFVRLANGEIAVVVARGGHANKPRVATMIGAQGVKLQDPIPRDSAQPEFAISGAMSNDDCAIYLDPIKLFGA